MADQANGSNSTMIIAFCVAVIAVGAAAWLAFGEGGVFDQPDVQVTIPGVGSIEGEIDGN